MNKSEKFLSDESGAVTVDWVVLTAGIIGLGVAVLSSVGTGTTDLAGDVQSNLTGLEIASYLPPPSLGAQVSQTSNSGLLNCVVEPCDPKFAEQTTVYQMSDDSQWTHFVYATGTGKFLTVDTGTVIRDTWTDGDGELVDAPEDFAG